MGKFSIKNSIYKVLTVEPIYRQQISVLSFKSYLLCEDFLITLGRIFSSRLQGVLYRLLAMYLDLYYNGLFEFPSSQGLGYGLLTVLRVQ